MHPHTSGGHELDSSSLTKVKPPFYLLYHSARSSVHGAPIASNWGGHNCSPLMHPHVSGEHLGYSYSLTDLEPPCYSRYHWASSGVHGKFNFLISNGHTWKPLIHPHLRASQYFFCNLMHWLLETIIAIRRTRVTAWFLIRIFWILRYLNLKFYNFN